MVEHFKLGFMVVLLVFLVALGFTLIVSGFFVVLHSLIDTLGWWAVIIPVVAIAFIALCIKVGEITDEAIDNQR